MAHQPTRSRSQRCRWNPDRLTLSPSDSTALPGTSRSGVGPVEFCSFTACNIPASSTPLARLTRQRASSVDSDFDDPDAEQPDADDLDDPEGPAPDLPGDPPLPTFGTDADETIPGGVMAQLAQAIAILARSASCH